MTKLNEIEGVCLSISSRAMFADFDDKGIPHEERRMAIWEKHSKGVHQPLEQANVPRLTPEDQMRFAEALINPPEPNARLRRSAKLHGELVEQSDLSGSGRRTGPSLPPNSHT
ncbi:DUF1778 domain-containing protein [Chelativorans alearense]|uniref:type II toxin -antitoxin system TacA 1-like antitoxin n=1 Tax=Chelativorans alearense TaxID=2681495 RepID=UPI0013D11943|nr:DUF1778 domain-containing protein [Chelativorans alearense]